MPRKTPPAGYQYRFFCPRHGALVYRDEAEKMLGLEDHIACCDADWSGDDLSVPRLVHETEITKVIGRPLDFSELAMREGIEPASVVTAGNVRLVFYTVKQIPEAVRKVMHHKGARKVRKRLPRTGPQKQEEPKKPTDPRVPDTDYYIITQLASSIGCCRPVLMGIISKLGIKVFHHVHPGKGGRPFQVISLADAIRVREAYMSSSPRRRQKLNPPASMAEESGG